MTSLLDAYGAFHRWLHTPVTTASVACYRIGIGAIAFASALAVAPDWLVWFGPEGFFSTAKGVKGVSGAGIDLLTWLPPTDAAAWAFWGVHAACALALLLGFGTRLAALGCFLTLASMHNHAPLLIGGGDKLLRMMALWLAFSQAGAAYSVDRWLRIRRGKEPAGPPPDADPWAQRMMQLQLAILYGITVIAKVAGEPWLDGTAVYYALHIEVLKGLPLPGAFYTGWASQALTWGTLVVETALAVLIWFRETRMVTLLAALGLHLGLMWSMSLGQFQVLMIVSLLVWVDPRAMWASLRQGRWPGSSAAI